MCPPAVIAAGAAVVGTAVSQIGASKAARNQGAGINAQSVQQSKEIADAADAALFDRQIEAMRSVGEARAVGAGRGVAETGSLLTSLMAINADADLDKTRIIANTETRQRGREAETNAKLSGIAVPTLLSAGLTVASAGVGAFASAGGIKKG